MTDYSQWLESVKMGHGGLIPLLIVFILAIEGGHCHQLYVRYNRRYQVRRERCAYLDPSAGVHHHRHTRKVLPAPPKDTPSFTQRTEQAFGVERIVCDYGCPVYGLPEDRTSANWM